MLVVCSGAWAVEISANPACSLADPFSLLGGFIETRHVKIGHGGWQVGCRIS